MTSSSKLFPLVAAAVVVALSCSSAAPGRSSGAAGRIAAVEARFRVSMSSSDDHEPERIAAHVRLPPRAGGPVRIEDVHSHVGVEFVLQDVDDTPIQSERGMALYPSAVDGADLVHHVHAAGTEDFVVFEAAPHAPRLVYRVDVSQVPGLRLVENTLEFLDAGGAPRLRVAPPYVVDSRAERHAATLALEGCSYDSNPASPWGREITRPGHEQCTLRVSWGTSVSYPALVDPSWSSTGSMAAARVFHTASRLPSGNVLVSGGQNSTGMGALKSAELYDPTTRTFAATGSMSVARRLHTLTTLGTGKIIVVGSADSSPSTAPAELYDPATGKFTTTATPSLARTNHTATMLPSGKVLVAGGSGNIPTASAELYDPATGTFASTGAMATARGNHTATLLASGRVLVAGGVASSPDGAVWLATAEIYDAAAGAFSPTGPLTIGRGYHTANLLGSGKVLVAGGASGGPPVRSAELYDPALGSFAATSSLLAPNRALHTASVLPSGAVLLVGGIGENNPVAELYDPTKAAFAAIAAPAAVARERHTATVLSTGSVLVTGGRSPMAFYDSAELFMEPHGGACGSSGPLECASALCDDGVCCASDCAGVASTCRTCAPATGACLVVKDADDLDTCTGVSTCDASGACRLKPGQPCTTSPQCAGWCNSGTCENKRNAGVGCRSNDACSSGSCTDGVCCDKACAGDCEACDIVPGTCALVDGPPHGARPRCASGKECRGRSIDCEQPFACDGEHATKGADGRTQECAPYKCSAGRCRQECASVNDCVAPAVCDVGAKCVLPPNSDDASGCAVSAGARGPQGSNGCCGVGVFALAVALSIRRRRAK